MGFLLYITIASGSLKSRGQGDCPLRVPVPSGPLESSSTNSQAQVHLLLLGDPQAMCRQLAINGPHLIDPRIANPILPSCPTPTIGYTLLHPRKLPVGLASTTGVSLVIPLMVLNSISINSPWSSSPHFLPSVPSGYKPMLRFGTFCEFWGKFPGWGGRYLRDKREREQERKKESEDKIKRKYYLIGVTALPPHNPSKVNWFSLYPLSNLL